MHLEIRINNNNVISRIPSVTEFFSGEQLHTTAPGDEKCILRDHANHEVGEERLDRTTLVNITLSGELKGKLPANLHKPTTVRIKGIQSREILMEHTFGDQAVPKSGPVN